ncbi:MAG: His-Xaa-Ser system radical SAM maturase HxsB [bacterium]|nr:His-Xaa-Ser system radical SAM maturase HxsB [bacterium]
MKNYYNYKKINDSYLITNDLGRSVFLSDEEFQLLNENESKLPLEKYTELTEKYFVYKEPKEIFSLKAGSELREYKRYLFQGTSLHIFVVTKNCNQHCIYCQASANNEKLEKMDNETAKRAVDLALCAPGKYLTFEFQGGEPLLNFETIKYIVEYTKEVNVEKNVEFVLVSNLLLLTEEMLEFFVKNNVSISTSLDGDECLHNRNRPAGKLNVFEKWEKQFQQVKDSKLEIGAIQTTTKYTLNNYKELVDAYVSHGLDSLFIRPLTRLGYAAENWDTVGYTSEEFLEFYKNSLLYMIELCKNGTFISERHASIFLSKILQYESINYMELRSPCGGAIGQLAYYYNGDVYTCDEGRMLGEMGDKSFCLGNVYKSTYKELMKSPVCKTVAVSSCLENHKNCSTCVYSPYCGTCPVISYALYGTIFPDLKEDFRCRVYQGILDILFELILENDESTMKVLYDWVY